MIALSLLPVGLAQTVVASVDTASGTRGVSSCSSADAAVDANLWATLLPGRRRLLRLVHDRFVDWSFEPADEQEAETDDASISAVA
jgi:hypothetical protein